MGVLRKMGFLIVHSFSLPCGLEGLAPSEEVGVQQLYFQSSQLTLRGGLAENPFTVAHVLSGLSSAWPGADGVCRERAHSHFS